MSEYLGKYIFWFGSDNCTIKAYKNDDNSDITSDINSDYYLDDSDDDNYYSICVNYQRLH